MLCRFYIVIIVSYKIYILLITGIKNHSKNELYKFNDHFSHGSIFCILS